MNISVYIYIYIYIYIYVYIYIYISLSATHCCRSGYVQCFSCMRTKNKDAVDMTNDLISQSLTASPTRVRLRLSFVFRLSSGMRRVRVKIDGSIFVLGRVRVRVRSSVRVSLV